MPGWGTFFGGIADFFGSRKERLANKISKIQKELNELQGKQKNKRLVKRYVRLSAELRKLQDQASHN